MTKGLNWRRARLHGRRIIDHRWDEFGEFRRRDAADRWLEAAERRLRQERTTTVISSAVRIGSSR